MTDFTTSGIHLGSWMGMKSTGKPVEITAVKFDRIAGGRIVEHTGAANLVEPLLAIGAIQFVSFPLSVSSPLCSVMK